jgi:hypothetical protein
MLFNTYRNIEWILKQQMLHLIYPKLNPISILNLITI